MEARESARRYQAQSTHYLENAARFVDAGDLEKASEFLWGGMAEALKAVAASRGIKIRRHSGIRRYAADLAKALGDRGIWDAFGCAQSLHSNFYETGLLLEDVDLCAQNVRAAVKRLFALITTED